MPIGIDITDGVATFRFDRPPVNAIDNPLLVEAETALARLESDDDVRAPVLTGVHHPAANGSRSRCRAAAAANGNRIAGGLGLALVCDIRVGTTAPGRLGLTEGRAGIPFPAVAMAVVRAELPPAAARRLTLLARNYEPSAALADGVLDELQPPDAVLARARAVARDLGGIPRLAYARIKQQLRADTLAFNARIVASGTDPLVDGWLTPETSAASAALLARER